MESAGLAEVERAKKDGRWEPSDDSQLSMIVPEDFMEMLKQRPKALQFFNSLNQ
jgi:uncharacterized protein YdeI (YjbR/CyaY-like superfamily)